MLNFRLFLLSFCLIFNVYSHPTIKQQLVERGLNTLLDPQITEEEIIKTLQQTHAAACRYQINPPSVFKELKLRCERESMSHKSKIGQKHEHDSLKPGVIATVSGLVGLKLMHVFYKKVYQPDRLEWNQIEQRLSQLGVVITKRQVGWGSTTRNVFDFGVPTSLNGTDDKWVHKTHRRYASMRNGVEVRFGDHVIG